VAASRFITITPYIKEGEIEMKRTIFMLVVAGVLLLLVFAACNRNGDTPADTGDQGNQQEAATPAPSPDPVTPDPEPEPEPDDGPIDMGGWTLVWASHWIHEYEGEGVLEEWLDLVYYLENKYNMNFEFRGYPVVAEMVDEIITEIMAGDMPFHLVDVPYNVFLQLMAANMLRPIHDIPEFQMNSPVYNASTTYGTTFGPDTYGLWYGSANQFAGVFVNLNLLDMFGLQNPYELWRNGQWTWDMFREMALTVTVDNVGNPETDIFGVTLSPTLINLALASNNSSRIAMQGGNWVSNLSSPNSMQVFDWIRDLNFTDRVTTPWVEGLPRYTGGFFVEDRSLFLAGEIWYVNSPFFVNNYSDMFSFVPFPVGPNGAEHVGTFGNFRSFVMPMNVENPEWTAIIFHEVAQAMGPLRTDTFLDVLRTGWIDDNGISSFLHIMDNSVSDRSQAIPGLMSEAVHLGDILRDVVSESAVMPASQFTAYETAINSALSDFFNR